MQQMIANGQTYAFARYVVDAGGSFAVPPVRCVLSSYILFRCGPTEYVFERTLRVSSDRNNRIRVTYGYVNVWKSLPYQCNVCMKEDGNRCA